MCRLLTFVMLHWLLASAAAQERPQKSYNGDKLIAVEARDKRTWNTVIRILVYNEGVQDMDVWKEPDVETGHAHIRIPARDLNRVIRELDRRNISHYILIDNIQRLIDGSRGENDTTIRTRRSEGTTSVVGRYARYDEILQWMDDVTREHPDVASIISIGKSFEGRDTRMLKLGLPGKNKWRIWLDGGIHAREWISPATVISIVHQLLQDYKTSAEGRTFLEKIDWYILPVVNPDGYEYSHVTDRLWRKNRRPITKHCTGVDLNRNWNYHWGGYNAALDPCSNLFRGDRPASEPEVKNIIDFLLPRADAFRAFVSLHNYYQMVTTRWAYAYNMTPPDHEALLAVAQRMVAAMSDTHNMMYQAGSAPQLLYPYAGGSGDWARGIANITYAYLVELRDKGQFGFLLPSSQIVPVGEEMWAGMKVVARQILAKHSNESVPEVIPDVTYRGDDVTTVESTTPGVRTTRFSRVETTTNRVTTRESTVRVTTRGTTVRVTTRRLTTRGYLTRRVTTPGYTTRKRVESTTRPTIPRTKTQIVSHGPTSPLVARGPESSTTSDVIRTDQTPSSEELVKTSGQGGWTQTLTSGQSSITQSIRPVIRTQRVDVRDGNALARDFRPTPSINGSFRTCHVMPGMLVGFCVCLGAVLTRRL